jgi:Holliday junction resolvase
MPKTPESRVKAACVEILKSHNAYYFFPVTGGFGKSGVPDIIVCWRGVFLAIECKAGYNKPTLLQEREMHAIERAGGTALVIREDSVDMLDNWFTEMERRYE